MPPILYQTINVYNFDVLPFKAGFHSFKLPQSLLQLTIYKVNEIGNLRNKIKWLA